MYAQHVMTINAFLLLLLVNVLTLGQILDPDKTFQAKYESTTDDQGEISTLRVMSVSQGNIFSCRNVSFVLKVMSGKIKLSIGVTCCTSLFLTRKTVAT